MSAETVDEFRYRKNKVGRSTIPRRETCPAVRYLWGTETMQYADVKVVDRVATIVMDRQEVCNALNGQVIIDLQQALSDVHQEMRIDAVVITGKGDHFCSGIDLKWMVDIADMDPTERHQEWFQAWRELTELCETILRFPKPVIAAVDGPAIGAGLAIALAADLMVLSENAKLQANAVERGLIGGVTAPLLSFRFGSAIAARMLLTGEAIDAEEANRLGMCCQVVASNQIWVAATEWGKRCSGAPHESLQATKRILNEGIGEALFMHLASGAATGATLCSTESAEEGMRAFVEKRQPKWPGRRS